MRLTGYQPYVIYSLSKTDSDASIVSSLERTLMNALSDSNSSPVSGDNAEARGESLRRGAVIPLDPGVRRNLDQGFAAVVAPEPRTVDAGSRQGSRSPRRDPPPERAAKAVADGARGSREPVALPCHLARGHVPS